MVQIVIPMSGLGKRFVQAGYKDPKPLIPVDGKPMIEHVIGLFPGEPKVLAICNEDHLAQTNLCSELRRICPTITILSTLYRGLGPVDTVLLAGNLIDDNDEVIVSYCDYGTQWNYRSFLQDMRSQHADGGIACYRGFHPHNLGKDFYATVRETDRWAQEVREKGCFRANKMDDYTSNGTYYFRTGRILKEYCQRLMNSDQTINGEYYMSLVYNPMLADGLRVRVFEIERMLQWGTPYDLEVYQMWSGCCRSPQQTQIYAPGVTVLPMAGRGERFRMEGFTTPKPFLPIHGNPMVVEALKCLPKTDELRIVTLREHEDIQPYFPNADVTYLNVTTDGQATTCMLGLNDVMDETPLTITACDNGAIYDSSKLQALLEDPSVDVIVWSFHNNPTSKLYPHMYAWLDVDENNVLRDVSIKKPFADRPNTHAIIGTMYFRQTKYFRKGYDYIVNHGIRTNGEFYVDNVLKPLVDMGLRVVIFPVDYYLCWGTPNDYKTYVYWDSYFQNASDSASHKHD
jgi:NDP-sugar pyrophosphorylase family protein